jgi:ABC-type sugar transport system ATPase subunit
MPVVQFEHVDLIEAGAGLRVHDFDLGVSAGELVILLGDEASGARAVLRAASGDPGVRITEGLVRIGSRVVNEIPGDQRDVAMIFRDYSVYPHMTVAQNLAFPLRLGRLPQPEINRRVRGIADLLDLTRFLERKPGALNAEQRRSIVVGRALIRNVRLLLETDAVDLRAADIDELLKRSKALLDVQTPAVLAAATSAQGLDPTANVAVMDAGRLVQRGTVSELRGAPASLTVARTVADEPLIAVSGTLEQGWLRVGPHLVDLPGLHPALRATGHQTVDVVLGSGSLVVPGEPPSPGTAVLSGSLQPDLDARIQRLNTAPAGPGRVEVALDPGRIQLFEPGSGLARMTWLPPETTEQITIVESPQRGPEPVTARGPTYVNVGFAALDDARQIVERDHLDPGGRLWLWVELGPRVAGAVAGDVEPMNPDVLKDLDEVEVVLFPDSGLTVEPDPALGRLAVTAAGPFRVRQAAARAPHAGALAAHRLFFSLTSPTRPGDYRLRCAVYAKGLLLHVEQLTVVVGQSRKSISARTTFRLVHDIAAVAQHEIGQHRLSIYANAAPDGSHDFSFRGSGDGRQFTRQVRLDKSTVGTSLKLARAALHHVSWGSGDEYAGQSSRYDQNGRTGFAPALAAGDVVELARWGYYLWVQFARTLPGDEETAPPRPGTDPLRDLRVLMRAPGGAVQLAPIHDPDEIIPIQLLYDRLLDAGSTTLTLCSNGAAWIGSGTDELPCLDTCSEPDDPNRVCPAGFWGLRHLVSVTPSPEDMCHRGLPPKVRLTRDLQGSAGFTTDRAVLDAAGGHRTRIRTLLRTDQIADDRDQLKTILETVRAQVLYFLCHVAHHDTVPQLVVGPSDGPGVDYTTLVDLWAPNLCTGSPLVVLNACNSAAPSPERLLSLVRGFLERGAAGAIGTEITVFVSLAVPFAEHFLCSYVDGVALGEAIRRARVAMLARGNPLGLAYIAFGLPELALVAHAPADDVPAGAAS